MPNYRIMEKYMARGINKVILVGNVGVDPDVRYMPNGNAVTTLSLATSESWKDKQTGDKQERTEWHRIVFYNRLAEIVGEYLKKIVFFMLDRICLTFPCCTIRFLLSLIVSWVLWK